MYMRTSACVPYLTALLGAFYPTSTAVGAATRVKLSPLTIQLFLLSYRPVPITTSGIAPRSNPVAIVAIVSIAVVTVSYSVIYQGSILVLAELADQLGFQS